MLYSFAVRLLSASLLALVALALPAGLEAAPPAISFAEGAVAVSPVSPGGEVIVFSVWRERLDGVATQVSRLDEQLADEDRDGRVVLDLEREVPVASIWAAVDLATGESAVAVPEGYRQREIAVQGRRIDRALENLEVDREGLELLLVRPGTGAWTLTVRDGGPDDEDGEPDGRLRARFAGLQPGRGSAAAPARLQKGDVLIAVDPRRMDLFSLQVAE